MGQDFSTYSIPHEADEVDVDSIDGLVDGLNILAVEVHEASLNTSDVVWGSQLNATVRSAVLPPAPIACPALNIERSDATLVLSWEPGSGCTLQQANFLTPDPAQTVWTDVTDASNPFIIPAPDSSMFYRLIQAP